MKSFLTSSSRPIMGSFLSFLPLEIQAVVEAEKLRFFPAFNQVPWQCENSYCNIVVLKEAIFSGYTEGVWRLHGAPCFMLRAHMVGNCSLLDPQTTACERWGTDPSYGLNMSLNVSFGQRNAHLSFPLPEPPSSFGCNQSPFCWEK